MQNTNNLKYRLIYQIAAASPVLLGLVSTILTIKFFGTGKLADAYLGALAISSTLGVITIMPFDQFLHFYNAHDVVCQNSSKRFFNATFTLSLIVGLVSGIGCYLLAPAIVDLFYPDFAADVKTAAAEILRVSLVTPAFVPVFHVVRCLLNAHRLYMLPYVVGGLPSLFTVCAFTVALAGLPVKVKYLAYGTAFGNVVALIVYLQVLHAHGLAPQLDRNLKPLWALLKNSTMIRLSGNIYTVFLSIVVNKFLSGFDGGVVSAYSYADKAVNSAVMVSSGPVQNIYVAGVSRLWYEGKTAELYASTSKYLMSALTYFVVTSTIVYLVIPHAFGFINPASMGRTNIQLIVSFFLLLTFWKLVVLVESPFVVIPQAAKVSWIFFLGNGLYVLVLAVLAEQLRGAFGVLSITVAAIIAQFSNLGIYYWYTKGLMARVVRVSRARA